MQEDLEGRYNVPEWLGKIREPVYTNLGSIYEKEKAEEFLERVIRENSPNKKMRESYLISAKEEILTAISDYVAENKFSPKAVLSMEIWCSALEEIIKKMYTTELKK